MLIDPLQQTSAALGSAQHISAADPVAAVRASFARFGDCADRKYTMTPGINVPENWEGFHHTETYRAGDHAVSITARTSGLLNIDADHIWVAFRERQRTPDGDPIDTGDPERLEWAEHRESSMLTLPQYAAILQAIKAAGYRSSLPKPATMQRAD